jgi:hypothetical protein
MQGLKFKRPLSAGTVYIFKPNENHKEKIRTKPVIKKIFFIFSTSCSFYLSFDEHGVEKIKMMNMILKGYGEDESDIFLYLISCDVFLYFISLRYSIQNCVFNFLNIKYLKSLNAKILFLNILRYVIRIHVNMTLVFIVQVTSYVDDPKDLMTFLNSMFAISCYVQQNSKLSTSS